MKTKKMKLSGILSLLLVGTLFTSCELTTLDEPTGDTPDIEEPVVFEPNTIPATLEEFKTQFHGDEAKSWTNMNFTLAGLNGFQDCRLDDTIAINADGTYEYDGGEVLCGSEDDERIRTGIWEITNDGKNIVFDKGTNRQYIADVNGLDQNTLSISGSYLGLPIKGIYSTN